jgi:Alkylmercury lyase
MDDDTFDVTLRTAVYRHFATTGQSPTLDAMREAIGATSEQVRDGYRRLYAKRMLVPAGDFASIRMAPPFAGVHTQHRAMVSGTEYFANCAWDAFGVVAALGIGLTDTFWDPRADRF